MDPDSPLVREEAKWSTTPSCRPLSACRFKMPMRFEGSVEGSCFLQAASHCQKAFILSSTEVLLAPGADLAERVGRGIRGGFAVNKVGWR